MNLDELYGELKEPKGVRPIENTIKFRRIEELSEDFADKLNMLLDISNEAEFFRFINQSIVFLWIGDHSGRILLSIEEACLTKTPERRFPRMRGMPLDGHVEALGHPLLVGRAPARIAGELFLDEGVHGLEWSLNNKSGRYGVGPTRTRAHLENVAGRFRQVGVFVETTFYGG